LLFELTAPYAASIKQPISSGCFIEWLLPDSDQGATSKAFFLLFEYLPGLFVMMAMDTPQEMSLGWKSGRFFMSSAVPCTVTFRTVVQES
jgi:hypothetical protein